MTEEEWLACTDQVLLLHHLDCQMIASDRNLRLVACAACRQEWGSISDPRSRDAVAVAESFADGSASERELKKAYRKAKRVANADGNSDLAIGVATAACFTTEQRFVLIHATGVLCALVTSDELVQFVRDIFGNPFRPVAFDPRWRSADAVGLARGIYDERAFERLPLLADALMDAECGDEQVLSHCRSEGPHVRGCWVVDLVLGKE
jgi:hypothetical protein